MQDAQYYRNEGVVASPIFKCMYSVRGAEDLLYSVQYEVLNNGWGPLRSTYVRYFVAATCQRFYICVG